MFTAAFTAVGSIQRKAAPYRRYALRRVVDGRGGWNRRMRLAPTRQSLWRRRGRPAIAGTSASDSRGVSLARLEAVLFVAGASLSSRKLAQFAGLADGTQARTLVRRLNDIYDREGSAFRVEEIAGGFQLMTRPQFGPWLRRLQPAPVEDRLSTPAMETLAVIAYRQPVLRAELEALRGVQCGEMLRQLSQRDLVRVFGRAQELGRPFLYGTTKRFLQVFGLRSLEELPRADSLRIGRNTGQREDVSASRVSQKSMDCLEESEVKIATLAEPVPEQEIASTQEELSLGQTPFDSRADMEYEEKEEVDDDDDELDDDDDELDDDELDDDDLDDDFDDEWEEVDDDDDWEEEEDEEED